MIKEKIQKNKDCSAKQERRSGFVILFAVTLSAILLSIALGVANIALREIKFGTSAKDTNNAFFAADVGAECALFNDRTISDIFVSSPSSTTITCNDISINVNNPSLSVWSFTVSKLGNDEQGCAKVTVDKTTPTTQIISNGYNNGGSAPGSCVQASDTVERQLEVNYSS